MNKLAKTQRALVVTLSIALVTQPACSYLAVMAPPEGQPPSPVPQPTAPCTRRMVAPVLDTIGAVTVGAYGVLFTAIGAEWRSNTSDHVQPSWDPDPEHGGANTLLTLGIGTLVIAAITGLSAVHGYRTVHECRSLYPLPPRVPRSQRRWLPPPPPP